jgi:UDP-N-acetyl-D-galactosamine dehydrogenase
VELLALPARISGWADATEVKAEYGIELTELFNIKYDAVIIATAHDEFEKIDLTKISNNIHVLFDTKSVIEKSVVDGRM